MNFQSILNYENLLDYINDDDALRIFTNKMGYRINDDGGYEHIPLDSEDRGDWHKYTKSNLTQTVNVMNNQIIVYMATIVETSMYDFFLCIFKKEPNRILSLTQLFDDGIADLGFSFSDFLKYESKDDYINEMANRASQKCNSGKIKSVFKRIKDITGLQIPNTISNAIIELVRLRNEIVHERITHDLKYDILKSYSDELEKLLFSLAIKVYELNINVNDPGDLLGLNEYTEDEVLSNEVK
nr:HEPN domain-containing protein [Cohnella sp. WQ 127256]